MFTVNKLTLKPYPEACDADGSRLYLFKSYELTMHIKGGYILQPRVIDDSDIMKHPPIDREIWFYLLRMVNHADNGKYKRGSGFFSFNDIQKDLEWFVGYRREEYSKPQISKSIQRLVSKGMVKTTKATRGISITVCKYDYYQEPKNYEGNAKRPSYESNDESATKATAKGTAKETPDDFITCCVLEGSAQSDCCEGNGVSNDEGVTGETASGDTKNKNDKNDKKEEGKDLETRVEGTRASSKRYSFEDKCEFFIKVFNETKGSKEKPSKYKLNDKVRNSLKARLNENYKSEDFIKAINNCKKDEYHIETNLKFLTPEFILRSDKLERFLNIDDKVIPLNGKLSNAEKRRLGLLPQLK